MSDQLVLVEAHSRTAVRCLTRAAQHLETRREIPALAAETLTAGTGARIGNFMRSLEDARSAVAVAGGSAARIVAASIRDSDSVDRSISQALGTGFATANEFGGGAR
ncbi:hypothetical protein K8P10_002240 [Leucobacter sp. Psy1]|uniref:hypothetical protein n=1 Tax=Leucobacter sp. Psy1 TaxID=2875729 RepID=UPI001CD3FB3F|nr:hypothetical protein [Leucobacter sp. Psy1]UBH06729.1 hypothetical protein K8P10_002240 [Leucobacter sp. Psy1]